MTDRRMGKRRASNKLSEAEKLFVKGARAVETALDALAEDPEAAVDKAGEFLGRFLATAERVKNAYEADPSQAKREIRNVVISTAAELSKRRRQRRRLK